MSGLLARTNPELAARLPKPEPRPAPKAEVDDRPAWIRRLDRNAKALS